MKRIPAVLRLLLRSVLWLALATLHLWALLALYFWFQGPSLPALAVCAFYALALFGVFRFAKARSHGGLVSLVLFVAVVAWWTRREPEKGLIYQPETAESVTMDTDLNVLTVHAMRHFRYRSLADAEERWATRSYDLDKLRYVDLYFVHWGIPGVAHIITSFVFENSPPLAVSIELRREKGESDALLRGFFKQYELHYVWSDEIDLIKLRTNLRKEEVYLHRTSLTPEQGKKLLRDMARRTNWLAENPEFYNTLTDSCANVLSTHLMAALGKNVPWSQLPLLPGSWERRGYEEGWLLHANPDFAADREASHINARAQQTEDDKDFPDRIRTHLSVREFSGDVKWE